MSIKVNVSNAIRLELGEHAPRIEMFKIPTDKIREVIGTGGKVIARSSRRPAPRSTSRTMAR
jgi:polyribonucleotide nucleotidyltransferase